jgi:hypothetical protein
MKKIHIFLYLVYALSYSFPSHTMEMAQPILTDSTNFLDKWSIPLYTSMMAGSALLTSYILYKATKTPLDSFSAADLEIDSIEIEKIKAKYVNENDRNQYIRKNRRDALIKYYGDSIAKVVPLLNLDKKKIRFAWNLENDFESVIGIKKPQPDSEGAQGLNSCVYLPVQTYCNQTQEEQEAVLAHELVHIKERHNQIAGLCFIPMLFGTYLGINAVSFATNWIITNNNWQHSNSFLPLSASFFNTLLQDNLMQVGITAVMCPFFMGKLKSYQEKRADIGAARALMSTHGLITLLKKQQVKSAEYNQQRQKNNQNKNPVLVLIEKSTTRLQDYFIGSFFEHPSLEERIDYLAKLPKTELDLIKD